jgi:hypothetical protein
MCSVGETTTVDVEQLLITLISAYSVTGMTAHHTVTLFRMASKQNMFDLLSPATEPNHVPVRSSIEVDFSLARLGF